MQADSEMRMVEYEQEVCPSVYYSDRNTADLTRCPLSVKNAFQQSGQGTALPGNVQCILPNQSIQKSLNLRVKLPNFAASGLTSVCLARGWLWSLIGQVSFRLAGASTPITYSGVQLYMLSLLACETDSKKNAIERLAGPPIRAFLTASPYTLVSEDYYINSDIGASYTYSIDEAVVCLMLPWVQNVKSQNAGLPLDLSLLNAQTQISVTFNSLFSIFNGTSAAAIVTLMGNRADTIEFDGSQADWMNPLDSLKTRLLADPMYEYRHLMHVPYGSYDSGRLTTQIGYDALGQTAGYYTVSVVPPTGNTVQLLCALVSENDFTPSNSAGACYNPLRTYEIRDVNIQHNSKLYAQEPGRISRFNSAVAFENGGADWPAVETVYAGGQYANGPAWVNPVYVLSLSMHGAIQNSPAIMNPGVNFGGSPVTIKFTAPTVPAGSYYHLYYIFIYNAALKISMGGSRVEFII